jgi:glycosyltransferase involved in cell wall biosynthesis
MKVGIYLRNFAPEGGGASTFENDVFNTLISSAQFTHHTFTIFTAFKANKGYVLPSNVKFSTVIARKGITQRIVDKCLSIIVKPFEKYWNPVKYLKNSLWFERMLQQENIELVWYPSPMHLTTEIPFITTIWDLEHRKQPIFPEVSCGGLWENREQFYGNTLRKAFAVITGTETGKREIEKYYQVSLNNIKVVPFSTPEFALRASNVLDHSVISKYNLPANYLFYPAQFWPHKNHIRGLEALKILRDKYGIKQSLVFVGANKGNYNYIKEAGEKLGLSQQVFFLGFVPQNDMVALYQNAFALIYLSFFGPDNLPPLEAFALGCPVITADIPGAKDQLGKNALLFEPRSAEDLAEKIKLLRDDKDLYSDLVLLGKKRAKIHTGRGYIKKIFSILDESEEIRKCWGIKLQE